MIKAENGEPYKDRTQSGSWSEVHEYKYVGKPIPLEALEEEFEKSITASKYNTKTRTLKLEEANKKPEPIQILSKGFRRNADVVVAVLDRANGVCEKCGCEAPFKKRNGEPYLEVHHTIMLSKGGDDSVDNAMAVCPNCHRELHFGINYVDD